MGLAVYEFPAVPTGTANLPMPGHAGAVLDMPVTPTDAGLVTLPPVWTSVTDPIPGVVHAAQAMVGHVGQTYTMPVAQVEGPLKTFTNLPFPITTVNNSGGELGVTEGVGESRLVIDGMHDTNDFDPDDPIWPSIDDLREARPCW